MKKGFTLIELLAVIVILAIIALIATPIILNIVEDSKKSAVTESAKLYIDGLQNRIASENMTREFNPSSCTITNGIISCDGQSIDYTVDGDKPSSGTITFNNGVVTAYTLGISGYTVTKSGSTITTTEGESTPTYTAYTPGQLLQYDPVNSTSCTTGDTCYKWRVITANDSTSNPNITLQMDHNLVNLSAWVSQADYNDDTNYGSNGNTNKGPITALQALEEETASWDDSLKLNYTYDSSVVYKNYGVLSCINGTCIVAGNEITSNLKARMITREEVGALALAAGADEGTLAARGLEEYFFSNAEYVLGTGEEVSSGQTGSTELSWLIENTQINTESGASSNEYDESNCGYWTLTPFYGWSTHALAIDPYGYLGEDIIRSDYYHGVRPVITIPKSVLE